MPASYDYYKILGLSPSAKSAEIKAAYRSLAMEYHPDKNPSLDAHKQFVAINAAYKTLSEPFSRKMYDLKRHADRVIHPAVPKPNAADSMSAEEMMRVYWNSPAGKRKRKEIELKGVYIRDLANAMLVLSIPVTFFLFWVIYREDGINNLFSNYPNPLPYIILLFIGGMWYRRKDPYLVRGIGFFVLILMIVVLAMPGEAISA